MTQNQLEPDNRKTAVMNLDFKLASILCYTPILLLGVIFPIVWLTTEPKNNRKLRFHAMQGLILSGSTFALAMLNSMLFALMIPVFGLGVYGLMSLGSGVITLIYLGASIYAIIQVCTDKDFKFPVIGDIAESRI